MTEQIYFTLTKNYSNNKMIECYEPIDVFEDVYTVRIVYIDGEEEIAVGNLEYFNSKYEITENKVLRK